ncbi:DUF7681 family protein [Pseudomonas aeruginosa]|uniref:Acb2/Tad1 domain-containing protein n=1 Tax=Pseudomonas aeruginosa TaxID=287 RepID=UPI0016613486|nr:hypothetical protein [Pseudomonas aeruginosa]
MDNQHRQISGYRELSQAEIDQMNAVKAKAAEVGELLEQVRTLMTPLGIDGDGVVTDIQLIEGADFEPLRWVGIAQDHLQQGFMALTRAIARPTTF